MVVGMVVEKTGGVKWQADYDNRQEDELQSH